MLSLAKKGAIFLLVFAPLASCDFGDFVDFTFQCPARTTCPVTCVPNFDLCPAELQCQNGGTLCADGSCAAAGEACSSDLESPCYAECAPVACAKTVDYYDSCFENYQEIYDYAAECAGIEEEENTNLFTFTEPVFIFCYAWISIVTVLTLGWCAYNQRLCPMPGSTVPLKESANSTDEISWTQTAYRTGLVGNFLYALVILTLLGFQVLLAILTILYYIQQEAITKWAPVFEDEQQVLLAFEITWMVGIVWSFALKWPFSVRSLFYRRCPLADATYVAVFSPTKSTFGKAHDPRYITRFKQFLNSANILINEIMALIFSDVTRPKEGGTLVYCRVFNENGAKFFYFHLRRYNYDPMEGVFVPGKCNIGTTIGDFYDARDGLTSAEVERRRALIGPNTIRMKKPNIIRTIYHEFSGTFYTYQTFIIWTWYPLWYYYMALLYTFVVITGGLTVSFFNYRNEAKLYKITKPHSGGLVEARRGDVIGDGTIMKEDIVPGDVIELSEGMAFCDMVVIQSTTNLVVDESAITGEATPVSKTAIDPMDKDVKYDPNTHKRQTIYAGTTIIQSSKNGKDLCLVLKTGSFTAKGEMLREILTYERHHFKFDVEVQIVVIILLIYGIFGFIMTAFVLIIDSWIYGWFYGKF